MTAAIAAPGTAAITADIAIGVLVGVPTSVSMAIPTDLTTGLTTARATDLPTSVAANGLAGIAAPRQRLASGIGSAGGQLRATIDEGPGRHGAPPMAVSRHRAGIGRLILLAVGKPVTNELLERQGAHRLGRHRLARAAGQRR